MMTGAPKSDAERVGTSSAGWTAGLGDTGGSWQGTHTSSPVALEMPHSAMSARRTGSRAKIMPAASFSHTIARRDTVDTRQISPVVQ
jgi:hypothetical protein